MWPTAMDTKIEEFDAMELPGQQIAAAHANTPLDHRLNLDISAPSALLRHTCIAATIGKASQDVNLMEKLIGAGMNIAVLNMMFGTHEDHAQSLKMLRAAAKNYSTKMGRYYPLAIAIKLSGKKIRTGKIGQMYGETVDLKTGEQVKLTTDETYKDRCSVYTVFVDFGEFANQVKRHDVLYVDNELIMLKVEFVSSSTVTCKILRGGTLGSYKDIFIPHKKLKMPNFTEVDKRDINFAVHYQVDIIIASFVGSASTVRELKDLCGEKAKRIAIISNILTLEGYDNFDNILKVSNGIMITRQEFGMDINPNKLIIAQKNMIARANLANVPVLICAHVLSSMRQNHAALRAELLDVGNLVLDGIDGIMLSAETAIGLHPVEVIKVLNATCKEAEICMWTKQVFYDFVNKTPIPCSQKIGTAIAAVLAAQRTIAAAIVVVTTTGKAAQTIVMFKPRCPVIAVTRYPIIARQLQMYRGILPLLYEDEPQTEWEDDVEKRVSFCTTWGQEQGFIRVGDPVIIVSGWRQGSGFTNTMQIIYIEK